MKLQSRVKWKKGGRHRVMPPNETIRRIKPYMQAIGVTRVADSTNLDSLGIPVFSAIRPTDAGMDGISVYNGKGLTKSESLAGAMMEAVERYCGEFWLKKRYRGTTEQIKSRLPSHCILEPTDMWLQQRRDFDSSEELEWGECWDLISRKKIAVPLNFIVCPYQGPAEHTWYSSSNGLASGNNLEEALCHALAELIERDAYTLAMVAAQLKPRFQMFVDCVTSGVSVPDCVKPDRSGFPLVNLESLPVQLKRVVRRVGKNGVKVWLREITSDVGVPSFVASLSDIASNGYEVLAGGFGCHPNAEVAAVRAITEAAQGRVVQIQGTREDATQVGSYPKGERVLWCNDEGDLLDFGDIRTYKNDDILDDITLMLNGLRAIGISMVIAADMSIHSIPATVVKVIIPELECWMLTDFAQDECKLGRRAQQILTG